MQTPSSEPSGKRRRRVSRRAALSLLATAGLGGCISVGGIGSVEATRSLSVPSDGDERLRVANTDGPVTVTGESGRETVEATADIDGDAGIDLESIGTDLSLEDGDVTLRTDPGGVAENRVSVAYEVTVPESVRVDRIRTENGSVEVSGTAGSPTIESTNGSVTVEDVGGKATAETTNGSVTVADVGTLGDVATENGSLDVEIPAIDGDTTVRTDNASITAALDPTLSVTVEAATDNASISTDGDALPEAGDRSMLAFDLNGGGPVVTIATENGDIELTEL